MVAASLVLYNNNPDELNELIDLVIENELISKFYLIDNSSSNQLESIILKHPRIQYIFNNKNLGYGAGHNVAIRKTLESFKYHLILNPDISFKKGTIENLIAYMEANKEVGHVMPKVLNEDGSIQYVCKLVPSPVDLIFKRFLPKGISERRAEKFQLKFTGYNKEMNVPYLSGCFMFLRTAALKEVGLFDERFFMYPEDIDLTRRIHERYRTVFYPAVTVTHKHEAGSYKSKKLLFIHISNMVRYFNKWGWIIDLKRKRINKKILQELNYNNG